MSFLDRKSVVSYRCSCGRFKPLPRLYFCRYCFQIRCEFCVFSEIDLRHCPTCLESIPVADAWIKGNKCSNCLLCPMCSSNLTTRIFHGKGKVDADGDGKTSTPVKSYYLCCLFCHWSTRDIGMPDSTTSANKWPELKNPHADTINELVEYYKALSINDRMLRERKMHGIRRTYPHISGMSVAMVRQKAGLTGAAGLSYRSPESFQESSKQMKLAKGEATEAKNDLPDDIYTKPPDLVKVSTIKQRHRLPEAEPTDTQTLRYVRKNLTGKRSRRCPCEHNLIKPEFLPTSTKFKIHLSAYFLIPAVRIKTVEPLRAGKKSELLILIVNPTQHPTAVSFLPYEHESSDSKPELMSVPVRQQQMGLNTSVELPPTAIALPGRDDAAEFDDSGETPNFNDDSNVVAWRKANKVVIKLMVQPDGDLVIGSKVIVGFTLSHIYTNTSILQEKKQLNKIDHAFKMVLELGKSVGS